MDSFTYQKNANGSFLILKTQDQSFEKRMILENSIPGLLSMKEEIFNGEKNLYYDITDFKALSDFKDKKLSGNQLKDLFYDIQKLSKHLEAYFLSLSHIALAADLIFYKDEHWYFCYLVSREAVENETSGHLQHFAEQLLAFINHEDELAVVLGYQFYQMAKEENANLLSMIQSLCKKAEEEIPSDTHLAGENPMANSHGLIETKDILDIAEEDTEFTVNGAETFQSKLPFDMVTLGLFFVLCLLGLFYGVYLAYLYAPVNAYYYISKRDGILSVVFFIVGLSGCIFTLLSPRLASSRREKTKPKHDYSKTEVDKKQDAAIFEIPDEQFDSLPFL